MHLKSGLVSEGGLYKKFATIIVVMVKRASLWILFYLITVNFIAFFCTFYYFYLMLNKTSEL